MSFDLIAGTMNITNSSSAGGVVEEVAHVLAPLTPIGRHLLAVFCILLGLLSLFAGKKYFRTTLFILGFGCGFCFGVLLLSRIEDVDNTTTLIAASIAGAIIGGLGSCVGAASKFVLGSGIGGFLVYGFVRIGGVSAIGNDTLIWVVLIVCLAIALFVIWKAIDAATVLGTSLAGALLVIVSLAHFIPELKLEPLKVFDHPSRETCTSSGDHGDLNECLVELVCWGVLTTLGVATQWRMWEFCDDNRRSAKNTEDENESAENIELGNTGRRSSRRSSSKPKSTRPTRRATTHAGKKYLKPSKSSQRRKTEYARIPARDRRSGW